MDTAQLLLWFLFAVVVFGAVVLTVMWARAGGVDVPAYIANAPPLRPYRCSRTILSTGGTCAHCGQASELHRGAQDFGDVVPFAVLRSHADARVLAAGELARQLYAHSRGLPGYVARVQGAKRVVWRAWLGPAESLEAGELCAEHPSMLGALRVLLGIVLRRGGGWNTAPADPRPARAA